MIFKLKQYLPSNLPSYNISHILKSNELTIGIIIKIMFLIMLI